MERIPILFQVHITLYLNLRQYKSFCQKKTYTAVFSKPPYSVATKVNIIKLRMRQNSVLLFLCAYLSVQAATINIICIKQQLTRVNTKLLISIYFKQAPMKNRSQYMLNSLDLKYSFVLLLLNTSNNIKNSVMAQPNPNFTCLCMLMAWSSCVQSSYFVS